MKEIDSVIEVLKSLKDDVERYQRWGETKNLFDSISSFIEDELQGLIKELEDANGNVDELQDELESLNNRIDQLEREVEAS